MNAWQDLCRSPDVTTSPEAQICCSYVRTALSGLLILALAGSSQVDKSSVGAAPHDRLRAAQGLQQGLHGLRPRLAATQHACQLLVRRLQHLLDAGLQHHEMR